MRRFPRFACHACLGTALVTACAPEVAETPHASLRALSRAVEAGDTTTTLQYVDVDAVVGRLIRDFFAAARDSLKMPGPDTLSTEYRAHVDSIEAKLRAILRTDLGLPTRQTTGEDTFRAPAEPFDDPDSAPDATDEVLSEAVEIVGDGAVRYVGDTALVARVLRYAHFDTSATLVLALVPVRPTHWRLVALHNAPALAAALRRRQRIVLERANRPLRDSIGAYASVEDLRITRQPLEEWDRYAAEARVTVTNRSGEPLALHAVRLTGPHLPLGDSIGQLLSRPIVLAPESQRELLWRRPLRGDHNGPFDVVQRPTLYAIEIADLELRGTTPRRIRLYHSWEEFVEQNPLPPRGSRGVLASTAAPRTAELAAADGPR